MLYFQRKHAEIVDSECLLWIFPSAHDLLFEVWNTAKHEKKASKTTINLTIWFVRIQDLHFLLIQIQSFLYFFSNLDPTKFHSFIDVNQKGNRNEKLEILFNSVK